MGEATPAQAAAGTFVPMLGVGLGSGAVGASRGPAVPQLHSAIVERLRARIELCRRHHSTCESRYQRGQAESTDREHESTLHLLNIVQQGPGTRKSKAGRGSSQQPPEYSRANGEQRGPGADQKVSMRMALHGSLRRKIEGQKPGATSCSFPGSDFKRTRLDGAGPGPGHHSLNPSHSFHGSSARKSLSHGVGPDFFNMTLKEMKKEPVEVQSCGQSGPDLIFDFKDEGPLDPELQDLFDELTKSASPLNELELEMLKQDDAFGLDLGRPSSVGAAAGLCSPLDKPIKLEHSPDFGHVHCGSPQLRPASAGPAFALAGPSSSGAAQKANGPPARPCWPEISHAEQLKQMAAANQQQPSALLPHHPAPGPSGWSPGPAPLTRVGPPGNNCLFKPNGAHHLDLKVLGSKPGLNFSPKSSALMADPLGPGSAQQQHSPSSGPHSLHFQNQGAAPPALHLQGKPAPLPYKLTQQRQGSTSGPRQSVNGSLAPPPPRPLAPGGQMKAPGKRPNPVTSSLRVHEDDSLDQFSRHLTRPPPEYKRSVVGLQQPSSLFPGPASSQQGGAGPDADLQPCHAAHKMTPSPGDRRFGVDCPPQFQQHGVPGRLGPGQNKPRFLNPFALNGVHHPRAAEDPGLGGLMTTSWGSANKPVGLGSRRPPGLVQNPDMFQQRTVGPPNQVAPDPRMLPPPPTGRPGQPVPSRASPEQRTFAEPAPGTGSYPGSRANRVTFDFLPEGDNSVPGINTDSDFIDSLLKSGSGTDDWMKDINLDEILGSSSII